MKVDIMSMLPVKLILVVLVFILVDLIVGVIKAGYKTGFKSAKMRQGLYHKLGEILAVIFGVLCELAFPIVGIDIKIPIVSSICIYLVIMETGSIVENLAIISPNIQKILSKVFGAYKEEKNEEVDLE